MQLRQLHDNKCFIKYTATNIAGQDRMFLERQIRYPLQSTSDLVRIHCSEIKQLNEERLIEERKKYRETVDKIQKQTEFEVELLQIR